MRIFFLVGLIFFSDFIFAKKDDIPEFYINLYDSISNNQDICTINTFKRNFSFKVSESNDFKNSSLVNSLEFEEQLIVKAIIKEFICRQTYHMTGKQKEKLLSSGYQDIVSQLLRLDQVSDQNIWKLWEEYKQKHSLRVGSNNKYEQKLKDGLLVRKKARDKKIANANRKKQEDKKKLDTELLKKEKEQQRIQQQEQAKLSKKYDSKILKNFDYVSSYQQQRQQALEQTITDNGKQYVKTHQLDAQTQAFMQMQGIDNHQFESLSGTIFSHQLFQECVDHYKKAAKVIFEYGLKNSIFIPHLINFTQAAFEGTKHEEFALAVNLSNVAEFLAILLKLFNLKILYIWIDGLMVLSIKLIK